MNSVSDFLTKAMKIPIYLTDLAHSKRLADFDLTENTNKQKCGFWL